MKRHVVALVDPYDSAPLLAEELRAGGHRCIEVQSRAELPYSLQPSSADRKLEVVVLHHGDLAETAAQLRRLDVDVVIAGCELGVTLADQLSERMALPTNGTRLSPARRDKSVMIKEAHRHGLTAPAQICSDDAGVLADWAEGRDRWPIIVKPTASAGSDGVFLCQSVADIHSACERIVGQKNIFDDVNLVALAQEFLEGTEYVVDTVSCQGRHRAAAFWRYGKTPASTFGAASIELLPHDGEVQAELFAQVERILDALEISYGPAHCELIYGEGPPALVEIGARLNGGWLPELTRLCSGTSQVTLTAQSYVEPDRFLEDLGRPYPMKRSGRLVFLMPRGQGRITAFPRLGEIESLASCHHLHVGRRRGPPLPRIVGWVRLVHDDHETVEQDHRRIRELESDGLYQIEPIEET